MQGGGGSSFRSLIHYSHNLGQTGSCNFLEANLFHCSTEPDRLPHNPGWGGGGGGSPLESCQQAATDGSFISVHTTPGIRLCLIMACKTWAIGFLHCFPLQGQRGGQKLLEPCWHFFFRQRLAILEEFCQPCKSTVGKLRCQ